MKFIKKMKKTGKSCCSVTYPPSSYSIHHQIPRMAAFELPTQPVRPQLLSLSSQRSWWCVGIMSHQALSELHLIPPKTKVDTKYYVENILKEFRLPAISRTQGRLCSEATDGVWEAESHLRAGRGSSASLCHSPTVVPRQSAELLGEGGVPREQSRPKSHWRAVDDHPKPGPGRTEANNQHRAAENVAQVCVVTGPVVCALPSRGQYAKPCSQVSACPRTIPGGWGGWQHVIAWSDERSNCSRPLMFNVTLRLFTRLLLVLFSYSQLLVLEWWLFSHKIGWIELTIKSTNIGIQNVTKYFYFRRWIEWFWSLTKHVSAMTHHINWRTKTVQKRNQPRRKHMLTNN